MRCGYDVSILEGAAMTGVEKYALHLFSHLWRQRPDDEHLLFCRRPPECLGELAAHVRTVLVPAGRFWRWRSLSRAIRRERVDAFVSPIPLLPRSGGIPLIGTVYECPWRHATGEAVNWRHRAAMWLAAFQATRIITISEMTRSDMRAEMGRFAPPIELVPPSYDPEVVAPGEPLSRAAILEQVGLPDRPYCLFVSTIRPKKNVELLVETFADPSMAAVDLICVGKIADPSIVERARQRGATNVHFLGYRPNDQVSHLYRNADAFLYVSKNEGFGLPILEAFANGCPLIASRGGSIPEVAGDGALYLDELAAPAIRDAIRQLRSDEALRQRLRAAGRQRLDVYSWENSAARLGELLDEVRQS